MSLSAICKLENQENLWYNSVWAWQPGAPVSEGREWWNILVQEEKKNKNKNSPFLCLFVLFGGLKGPCPFACPDEGRSSLLSLQIQILFSLETPSHTLPEVTFYQLFRHQILGQSSWHIKLIITMTGARFETKKLYTVLPHLH